MPEEKTLAVDFAKENALSQILSRAPIISSQKADWDGIHVQYHQQPAHDTPEHCLIQHTIGMLTQCRSVVLERALNGRFQILRCGPGDLFLAPANTDYRSRCNEETEFIALGLEPAFFARAAYESVNTDRVEIIPHFSISDSLIQQIGLALKAELESGGLGSRLYAESLATALSVHLLRHYCTFRQKIPTYSGGLSRHQLRCVIDYINENLERDLTLTELAATVQMSPYHFARLFKQSTGFPPHQYLVERRLEKAKQYITSLGIPYAIVAPCGFMENTIADWALSALKQGKYSPGNKPPESKMVQIAASDIASFAVLMLLNRDRFLGFRVKIAGDERPGYECAEILSRVTGRQIEYVPIARDFARKQSEDFQIMWQWDEQVGTQVDIPALRREYPDMRWHSFEEWAKQQDWSLLDK